MLGGRPQRGPGQSPWSEGEGAEAERWKLFTVRRYALHGLSYRNSVRPSVTLVDCVEWMNTYIYIAPVKQKSSEALAAE